MKSTALIDIAKKAIDTEIAELERLRDNLNNSFLDAVELINKSSGKLIVVGIGKSAHVGNKIVATLNSTGTPAQFLHAAEAIHGDLGVVQKNDVVLCISNSGNSPEIVNLAPYLKQYSAGLIGMTGNLKSKLAEHSDIVLNTFVEKEACPNKLAPTSSTTVQMALGDALAVCLMEINHFKDTDFAKFHPGGSLGKNLTAKVGQFLSSQKPQVSEESSVKEVIISISASTHGVTVVTEGETIKGIITDGDLRRMLMGNDDIKEIKAKDIMSLTPKTIDKEALAKEAMRILKQYNIGQLIVTDKGNYFGIIDLHTLLDEGIL
ncbi:KpsF/GutQ family sugar-phosphate isomerase [Riemerella anatipestifer]|uniref:Putative sugar phosphate isomerase involved in capsule formation n=1 Tax=Riemerella anatipestifer RA-CH-1 TaxID=1228997 RepID=J9QU00_RIEAN|nr:KpsF/GutQ family sugar-phosphate isomerase [Riemerella anatipestifer]AFR36606.1 putative sugar phosphate isomerase involved in capsule formation [Riemerella anatipestifer RA-CH-1]MCO7331362.1 KpsF/GutQ family sugar-phosphate isomerase [Riemerella anatipestifer]MCO7350167.1 KpsF/GutQ family sugar-phosphate isomerase [Riemerella anatipestifer]MCU7582157.1 KpsF/GutQ family sugar-phosphate isomerase [Riemerella anatipestifer]MCW0492248.1 KpsF/GutQ family sugar-phosphate isomerase [Riemerella an